MFVNNDLKLCYLLGKKPNVIARLQKKMLLLGYVPAQNRLYLIDKLMTMVNYELLYQVVQYEQAIIQGNFEGAAKLLLTVPKEAHLKLAKFLEINEFKELAYKVTPELTHKYSVDRYLY